MAYSVFVRQDWQDLFNFCFSRFPEETEKPQSACGGRESSCGVKILEWKIQSFAKLCLMFCWTGWRRFHGFFLSSAFYLERPKRNYPVNLVDPVGIFCICVFVRQDWPRYDHSDLPQLNNFRFNGAGGAGRIYFLSTGFTGFHGFLFTSLLSFWKWWNSIRRWRKGPLPGLPGLPAFHFLTCVVLLDWRQYPMPCGSRIKKYNSSGSDIT